MKKYLFITRCIYPASLTLFIKDLPEGEQYKYCWTVSLIRTLNQNQSFFVNINRTVFLNKLGRHYGKILDNLKDWGIININDSYKVGSFTKSYQWSKSARESQIIRKNFKTRKPVFNSIEENILNNDIDIKDEAVKYTLDNINKLDNNYQSSDDKIEKLLLNDEEIRLEEKLAIGETWLKKIDSNNYRISVGENSGRLYHPAILMPKVTRQHLYYKHTNCITSNDIKACFPVLLSKFINEEEKSKYINYLDSDIYDEIRKNEPFVSREEIKISFQKFLNGGSNGYVKKWFTQNFPLSFPDIEKNFETMSVELQKMESNIMVRGVLPFCLENNFKDVVIMHDGWINSSPEQDIIIGEYVKQSIHSVCGYTPQIKTTINNL